MVAVITESRFPAVEALFGESPFPAQRSLFAKRSETEDLPGTMTLTAMICRQQVLCRDLLRMSTAFVRMILIIVVCLNIRVFPYKVQDES